MGTREIPFGNVGGISGVASNTIIIQEDGNPVTIAKTLNFVGDNFNVSASGDTASISLSGINHQDSIQFNTLANVPVTVGELAWNNTDATLDLGMPDGITLQIGQESQKVVLNNSGETLLNGTVVYLDSAVSGRATVQKAISNNRTIASKTIGVLTQDILNGQEGKVTTFGKVRNLNTASFSVGDALFVSSTAGSLTNIRPTGGNFPIIVGIVTVADATEGEIDVIYSKYDDPDDIQNATGFPEQNKVPQDFTTSFDNSTRTFSIAPTGTEYYFYQLGVQYRKTGTDTVVISDVEGIHFIYFDNGVLYEAVNPSEGTVDLIIRKKVIVRLFYWDATNKIQIINYRENHGYIMSADEHVYNHFTRGAQYISGLALSDITADENGSLNSHAQFGIASGVTADEDLINTIPAVLSTTGMSIYALSGNTANIRLYTQTGYSVLTDVTAGVGSTGRLVYNQFTGGAWQLTTCTDNSYVLCHIFTNNDNTRNNLMAFIGTNNYSSSTSARTGANTEISTILSRLPRQELVPIGTVIFQTRNTYSNSVKARILSTYTGGTYIDWRTSSLKAGASPSDHNALSGLQFAQSGVTYGHINDTTQTIAGEKTFANGININNANAFYFGDKLTDGSWRFIINGNNLNIEKRESGVWNVKTTITA